MTAFSALEQQWVEKAIHTLTSKNREGLGDALFTTSALPNTTWRGLSVNAAVRGITKTHWRIGHFLQSANTHDMLHEMGEQSRNEVESFWLENTMLVDISRIANEAKRLNVSLYSDYLPNGESNAIVSPICVPPKKLNELNAAEKTAYILQNIVKNLRELNEKGIPTALAAPYIHVSLPPSMHIFNAAAQARALRLCWVRLLEATHATVTPLHIVCRSYTTQLPQTDADQNMIRNTIFALSGILMQAEAIFLVPHAGTTPEAAHLARNTLLMLKHESRFSDVQDVAGGAYALETEALHIAQDAWDIFRMTEPN